MRSNAWTTVDECKYLEGLIPSFLSVQQNRNVGSWLASTSVEFLKKFPARAQKFNRESLKKVQVTFPIHVFLLFYSLTLQKLRTWYGNHTRDCVRGTDSRHVLDLSGKAHRRPLPLQLSQAYSILYYAEGTPLYQEIRTLYDKYKEGDEETIAKLKPLFGKSSTSTPETPESGATTTQTDAATMQANTASTPTDAIPPPPTKSKRRKQSKKKKESPSAGHVPKFVVFQQAIIREKVREMSAIEATAVDELIEERYAVAMDIWESPWLAPVKGREQASETELEHEYYQT